MNFSARMKIALAGALWFAFLAGASFPFAASIHAVLRPQSLAEVTSMANFSVFLFGVPAAFVGLSLANRIAFSESVAASIGLGVLLVVCTNMLTALFLAVAGSHFFSLQGFAESFLASAFLFFLFDVVFLHGIPFVLGGIASLAFRAAVQRSTWIE